MTSVALNPAVSAAVLAHCVYHLSMQHACTSAEGPRTTSGAVQANRTNGASATPLGPVWVHARYRLYPLRWGLERLSDGARNCRAVGLAPHDVERLWWRAGGLRLRRGSHCGQVCTTRHHLTSASYIIHTKREWSKFTGGGSKGNPDHVMPLPAEERPRELISHPSPYTTDSQR